MMTTAASLRRQLKPFAKPDEVAYKTINIFKYILVDMGKAIVLLLLKKDPRTYPWIFIGGGKYYITTLFTAYILECYLTCLFYLPINILRLAGDEVAKTNIVNTHAQRITAIRVEKNEIITHLLN